MNRTSAHALAGVARLLPLLRDRGFLLDLVDRVRLREGEPGVLGRGLRDLHDRAHLGPDEIAADERGVDLREIAQRAAGRDEVADAAARDAVALHRVRHDARMAEGLVEAAIGALGEVERDGAVADVAGATAARDALVHLLRARARS